MLAALHRAALSASLAVCVIAFSAGLGAAQTATFTRSDITGNDIDCGQGSGRCRVCGDINAIDSSCRANPACTAYTFDNSCGFLKSAGEPRSYREGFAVFLLTQKTPGAANTTSPGPDPVTASIPAAAAATPSAAAADPAAAANVPINTSQQNTSTPALIASIPSASRAQPAVTAAAEPAHTPVPAAAAAADGCVIPAWQQCGGKGADCASGNPGYQCVDGPFSGCTCVQGYSCQRKDQFFYQCAPPNYKFPTQQAARAATPGPTGTIPAAAATGPVQPAATAIPASVSVPIQTTATAAAAAAAAGQQSGPGFLVDHAGVDGK